VVQIVPVEQEGKRMFKKDVWQLLPGMRLPFDQSTTAAILQRMHNE